MVDECRLKQQEMVDCEVAYVHRKRHQVLVQIRKAGATREEKGQGEENGFQNWDGQ
jgi:hypothetical protein